MGFRVYGFLGFGFREPLKELGYCPTGFNLMLMKFNFSSKDY